MILADVGHNIDPHGAEREGGERERDGLADIIHKNTPRDREKKIVNKNGLADVDTQKYTIGLGDLRENQK